MKKHMLAVLSAAAFAAGLSVVPAMAQSSANAPRANGANTERYCYRERLSTAGAELSCNWAESVAEACRDNTQTSKIPVSAVAEPPKKASRCANGEWLVQVTLK
jgi:hypothetical protein